MEEFTAHIFEGSPEMTLTPYDLFSQVQVQSPMPSKIVKIVKTMLDYSMTFDKAFESSSHDLVHACISISLSYKNAGPV